MGYATDHPVLSSVEVEKPGY